MHSDGSTKLLRAYQKIVQLEKQIETLAFLLKRDNPTIACHGQILDQLHDVVIYYDTDCRILYVNYAFEKLFGWPRNFVIGKPAGFRFPFTMQSDVEGALRRVLAGESFSIEQEDYRANGSRVWMHWRARRLVDDAGRVTGAVNVGIDIDSRKRAEAERERLQQQLFQVQRMETLGCLAGGIAHDLNNIIAVIHGFTELAVTRPYQDEQTRRCHGQVLKATERARELVKRILSFSRFHEPERKPVLLQNLLKEAVKFMRAAFPSTVEIRTDFPADCPPTLADAHQITQILLNLATNAAHAIGDVQGTLTLRLGTFESGKTQSAASGTLVPGQYYHH